MIGAGPAGLTASLEMLRRTDIVPTVLEASEEIGGISRTIRYKGNRMDIGGHRFFSKSDRVMQWWMEMMPPEASEQPIAEQPQEISYQGQRRLVLVPARLPQEPVLRGAGPIDSEAVAREESGHLDEVEAQEEEPAEQKPVLVPPPQDPDLVMLIRPRRSRIYYLRKFFDYPITLTANTLRNLGPVRILRVGCSYLFSRLRQIRPERSLEDFLINRFGRELYRTFFKSYTEKVWGKPCHEISAEWGAQRIKGLSLTTALRHFLRKAIQREAKSRTTQGDLAQKKTDTSLIERFMYPKFGPGQLWEYVASQVTSKGGAIHLGWQVDRICFAPRPPDGPLHIQAVEAVHPGGERRTFAADHFLSTAPMRDLIRAMHAVVPEPVREVSEGLQYRDFITVGLLVNRLTVREPDGGLLRDTWIYVQEPDVLLGRLQIFNNWSPHLVSDPTKVWIGLEYFCYETDDLWKMEDTALQRFAAAELARIGIVDVADVLDGHVVRVPKTYPAYFGTYNRFDELRRFTDSIDNLYLIGRNGMHKYNNQDHSMLTAMHVVDGLEAGHVDRQRLWEINTEMEYHEQKQKV